MGISSTQFTNAMRQFPAAVNIVTTGSGDTRAGLTATAVIALTAAPPQIAVAICRSASAYRTLRMMEYFCVNTLTSTQADLARRFAGGVKGLERFSFGNWETLATGAPALVGALANFDCRTAQVLEFSTHTLFVGDVECVRKNETKTPLLFVDGDWATLLRGEQPPCATDGVGHPGARAPECVYSAN